MKITTKILVACLPGIGSGASVAATTGDHAISAKPDAAALSKVKPLAKPPSSFDRYCGQTDPQIHFGFSYLTSATTTPFGMRL